MKDDLQEHLDSLSLQLATRARSVVKRVDEASPALQIAMCLARQALMNAESRLPVSPLDDLDVQADSDLWKASVQ